jgi:hypothetical protein
MPPINFYYYGFMINCRRFFTKQMSRLMKKPLRAICTSEALVIAAKAASDARSACHGKCNSATHATAANVQLWVFCCLYCKLISSSELD